MEPALAAPRPQAWKRLALLGVGISVLVPVWASPLLVTQDGPSHLYNAIVAEAVNAGRAPFAGIFQVDRTSLRPNQATELLLGQLGRIIGWEPAERAVLSVAMVANFLVLMWLVGGSRGLLLAPAVAWLTHNWFAWMGFGDFALSLAWYGALVGLLAHPRWQRRGGFQLGALLLLYFAHFFSFVVGTGLALVVTTWRLRRHEASWSQLGALAPAGLLLLAEAGGGSATGGAALTWQAPWQPLTGLAIGDIVRSFHPLDAVGGVAIMAAVWGTVYLRVRATCGLGLLALSVVAPSLVGEGGYVPIRLQMLGVVTLLPAVSAAVPRLPAAPTRWLAGAVLVGFLAHGAYVIAIGSRVNRDLLVIDALLAQDGASSGAWVRSRFADARRGLFRIAGYRHLVERIAARRELVALDDYEARYGVFAVSWRARPDWLAIARVGEDSLELRLVPGEVPWKPSLYLVHEVGWRIGNRDARLDVAATLRADGFAVTRVRRRQ